MSMHDFGQYMCDMLSALWVATVLCTYICGYSKVMDKYYIILFLIISLHPPS